MKLFSEEQLSTFNALDYTIYNFMIEHAKKIGYMTIRELADEAHVSTASIARFCHKIECSGFSEFKIRFKIEMEQQQKSTFINDVSDIEGFLTRIKTPGFEQELHQVASILEQAKSLIFIGFGTSGVMANYAARYFSSIGKFAVHVDNPMFPLSVENPKDCVLVILSVEGAIGNLVEILPKLKAQKTTIVSLTNTKNSTIAKLSNYNLSYYIQRVQNYNTTVQTKIDVSTQIPVMFLLETLAKEVYSIKISKQSLHCVTDL